MDRLRATLGGVDTDDLGGDNLAILLASHFEPQIEDEELDDSETWKQGAIDAANRVLDAIHAHYAPSLAAANAEIEAVSRAIGGVEFMDLPDGGSPTLAKQVERMRAAWVAAEASVATLTARVADLEAGLPEEPTEELIDAGWDALNSFTTEYMDGSEVIQGGAIRAVYQAFRALLQKDKNHG